MVNIGGSDDPAYRYKMPRVMSKIEGRGNGIKTVIPNMVDVAQALNRDPAICTKYFGCELGAQSRYDPKVRATAWAHNVMPPRLCPGWFLWLCDVTCLGVLFLGLFCVLCVCVCVYRRSVPL